MIPSRHRRPGDRPPRRPSGRDRPSDRARRTGGFALAAAAFAAGGLAPAPALAQDVPDEDDAGPVWPVDDGAPLRALAARHGVRIGHAMRFDWPSLRYADVYEAIVAREFDIVTPESSMKWEPLRPAPGEYDFGDLDRLAGFARDHDIELHGHPLLWYRLNPDWVDELPAAELARETISHIETVMTRWPGLYRGWDVVNEALTDDGEDLRESPFLRAMGPDYVDVAFAAARASDASATLLYNDYDIGWPAPKGAAALELVDGLLARDAPLDGVGFQMHLDLDFAHAEGFSAAMQAVADRGLEVWVTEFDVAVRGPEDFDEQALLYEDVLERCLMQPACRAFQVWGLDDGHSFRRPVSPLPFDEDFRPKPAFFAMRRALSTRPVHPEACELEGLAAASGAVSPAPAGGSDGTGPAGVALARCAGVDLGPGYAELAVRYRNADAPDARLEVRVAGTGEPVASLALPPVVPDADGAFGTLRAATASMPVGETGLELELVGADAGVALDALLFDAPAGAPVEGFGEGLRGPGTGPPGGAGTPRGAIGGGGALPGESGGGEPVPGEEGADGAGEAAASGGAGTGGASGGGGPFGPGALAALGAAFLARARYLHRRAVPHRRAGPPCPPEPPSPPV